MKTVAIKQRKQAKNARKKKKQQMHQRSMVKKGNTFKFTSFLTRLSSVSVTATGRLRRHNAIAAVVGDDLQTTYFAECYSKWVELDPSDHFCMFRQELPKSEALGTLPQLVHCHNRVVDVILKHLAIPNTVAFASLLELIQSLARDLQSDFYVHFWPTLDVIAGLIERQRHDNVDSELVEAAFSTLAVLFKICWRQIVPEMKQAFRHLQHFFSHRLEFNRRFAAEATAFLVRKCQNLDDLLEFILTFVDETDGATVESTAKQDLLKEGVTELMFQSMRATSTQLHSCATQVMSSLLNQCNKEGVHASSVHYVCTGVSTRLIEECTRQHCMPLIRIIIEHLCSLPSNTSIAHRHLLLSLCAQWLGNRAKYTDPKVTQAIVSGCLTHFAHETSGLPDNEELLVTVVSLIVNALNVTDDMTACQVLDCILRRWPIERMHVVLDVFDQTKHASWFNQRLMPRLDTVARLMCHTQLHSIRIMECYASLVKHDRHMDAFCVPVVPSNSVKSSAHPWLLSHARSVLTDDKVISDHVFYVLYVLHAVDALDQSMISSVETTAMSVSGAVMNGEDDAALVASCAWASASLLIQRTAIAKIAGQYTQYRQAILQVLQSYIMHQLVLPDNEFGLRLLHLLLLNGTRVSDGFDFDCLQPAFFSPVSLIRQLAFSIAHLICEKSLAWNAATGFHLLLEAEFVPLTLEDYRSRLIVLRRLAVTDGHECWGGAHQKCEQIVKHLVTGLTAQLWISFTVIYPTINEIISTFAHNSNQHKSFDFWSHWLSLRQRAIKYVNQNNDENGIAGFMVTDQVKADKTARLNEAFETQWWKCTGLSADVAERHSRTLTPILEELISNNLDGRHPQMFNLMCDDYAKQPKSSLNTKLLSAVLQVAEQFADAKSLYRAAQFKNMLFELLSVPDPAVQLLALKCLYCYKNKSLAHYRENFERLLDDKTFSDELVLFAITGEEKVVEDEHRDLVIKMLIPILFGRMRNRVGVNKHGERHATAHAVHRYLTGLTPSELGSFISLALQPLNVLCAGDAVLDNNLDVKLVNQVDITRCLHPTKLISLLTEIGDFLTILGHRMSAESVQLLWNATMMIGQVTMRMYHAKVHLKVVKMMRSELTNTITMFFTCLPADYTWSWPSLQLLRDVWMQPQLTVLDENTLGCHAMNIRIAAAWADKPVLHRLLNMPLVNQEPSTCKQLVTTTLGACIITQVRHSHGKQDPWINVIIDVMHNLLYLEDESDKAILPDQLPQAELVLDEQKDWSSYNRGTQLLVSNLDAVISYVAKVIMNHMSTRPTPKLLDVLQRLCEFVHNCSQMEQVVSVLVSIARRAVKGSDSLVQVLECVAGMLAKYPMASGFIRDVYPLVSGLTDRDARRALCAVFNSIAGSNGTSAGVRRACLLLVDVGAALKYMNSWSVKRVDEPDFGRRQSAYTFVYRALEGKSEEPIDMEVMIRLLVHNNVYVLVQVDDMALRENARHSYEKLFEYMQANMKDAVGKELLDSTVLPGIRHHLNNNVTQACFDDLICVLGECARRLPDQVPFLAKLCHDDADLDVYLQLTHAQTHRRARVIRKCANAVRANELASGAAELSQLHTFLTPIAQRYVDLGTREQLAVSRKRMSEHDMSLADAAIELMSALAACMQWKRYTNLVMQYATQLNTATENTKPLVKIVAAIVSAFGHDVSDMTAPAAADVDVVDDDDGGAETKQDDVTSGATTPAVMSTTGAAHSRVIETMHTKVLPILLRTLNANPNTITTNGAAADYSEDANLARVPVALALANLLSKLPQHVTNTHLPGVISRMCGLLRSRAISVRRSCRLHLVSVCRQLGPKYLPFVIREIRQTLTRGYQVHVMCFTVMHLLTQLDDSLTAPSLDAAVLDVVEIASNSMFGMIGEERQVKEIQNSVEEARKGNKVPDALRVVARCVSANSIPQLLAPFKQVLQTRHSASVVRQCEQVVRQLASGLCDNAVIDTPLLLTHAYDALTASIQSDSTSEANNECSQYSLRPVDCRLIAPEPGRKGVAPVTSGQKGTGHVWMTFAWHCVLAKLQEASQHDSNEKRATLTSLMTPFVPHLVQSLSHKNDQVVSVALRVLPLLLRYSDCETLKHDDSSDTRNIVNTLFVLFNDCASATQTEAVERTQMLFNTMALMINRSFHDQHNQQPDNEDDDSVVNTSSPCKLLTNKQLKVLLHHVEACLLSQKCETAAFGVLRSLLRRGVDNEHLTDLVMHVRQLAITTYSTTTANLCRALCMQFVLSRPPAQRAGVARDFIDFVCQQLSYEEPSGRITAMELLSQLFARLPQAVTTNISVMCLVHVCANLADEDSTDCTRVAALALKQILRRASAQAVNTFQGMLIDWIQDTKNAARSRVGLTACQLMIEVEQDAFEPRLNRVLGVTVDMLADMVTGRRSMQVKTANALLNLLITLFRILPGCATSKQHSKTVKPIWEYLYHCCICDDISLVLLAVQTIGQLLVCPKVMSSIDKLKFTGVRKVQEVEQNGATDQKMTAGQNCQLVVHRLCSSAIQVLRRDDLTSQVAEQTIKNLLVYCKHLLTTPNGDCACGEFGVERIVMQMAGLAKYEIAKFNQQTVKRDCVFKWAAALSLEFDDTKYELIITYILPYLQRQIAMAKEFDDESTVAVTNLASQVCDLMRARIGSERYAMALAKCHKMANQRRMTRKADQAAQLITNPESAVRRKIKRNRAKQTRVKTKIDELKPHRKLKKRRMDGVDE